MNYRGAVLSLLLTALIFLLSSQNHVISAASNLIANPSAENGTTSPNNWLQGNWGTNTASFSYQNTGQEGSKSLKVSLSAWTSGDAKWYFNPVTVAPNTKYTFEDWYKSNVSTSIVVQSASATGAFSYIEIATLPASSSWTNVSKTFTTPADAKTLTVFHLINSVGSLETDNFSLTTVAASPGPSATPKPTVTPSPTKTPTPSVTPTPTATVTPSPTATPSPTPTNNVIPNPSLENVDPTNSNLPNNWVSDKWGNNTTIFSFLKNGGHTGSNAVKVEITKYTDGDAKYHTKNSIAVAPGDSYLLSDWYKSNVTTWPVVDFTLSDGSDYYLGLRYADPSPNNWAQFSESFQVPYNAKAMTIYHMIEQVGWITTDDYSLTKFTPKPLSRAIVSLTFDNGFEDNITTMLPQINSLGFKTTQVVSPFYLEQDKIDNPGGPDYMAPFINSGHEISSHTWDHTDMTTQTNSQVQTELTKSLTYLENLPGVDKGNVVGMSAPFGAYNNTDLNLIKALYKYHRTTDEGYNTPETFDPYRLEVQNMLLTTTQAQFNSWINQAIKDKSWLILVYHRIAPAAGSPLGEPDIWDTWQKDFTPQMQYIKQTGIKVETMRDALNEVSPQVK